MAPHSSQSSAPSPSLKRKQPTISSFFGGKSSPQRPSDNASSTQEKRTKKREASAVEEKPVGTLREEDDEDDDDIVAPPSKRARVTSNGSAKQIDENEEKEGAIPVSKDILPPKPSHTSEISSQRTDIFKFQSSAPTNDDIDSEDVQRKKEKEKLHQKFVRKLGGADCLIGIGRTASSDATAGAEAEEGDEEDEPAPPPTKGKASKKGGSKLTPMEKQVIEIKRSHMDTVLVVEVGYKFRFFGEDARTAAKELGIVCIPGKFRFDERKRDLSFCFRPELVSSGLAFC